MQLVPQMAVVAHKVTCAFAGKACAVAPFGETRGNILGKQFMPPRAVRLSRAVMGAVPQLVQLVIAGSAVTQIIQVVVGGVAVVVADLHALRTWADERFCYEGVDGAHLGLAVVGEFHERVSAPRTEGRSQELSLVAVNPAVGAGDGAVNAADSAVATDFVDSLVPGDGFPTLCPL